MLFQNEKNIDHLTLLHTAQNGQRRVRCLTMDESQSVVKYYPRKSLFLHLLCFLLCSSGEIVLILNLNLLDQNLINFSHHYRARSACTSVQSDQILYCWLTNFKFLKMIMESSKNGRWIIWLKKISRLRVK